MLQLSQQFAANTSWEDFVHDFRGRSYLSPTVETIDHPTTQLLRQWRDKRVPASTTDPTWTSDQKDHCVQQGCHISATPHADFLRQEMAEFIESKFWVVLPYKQVRNLPALMFSPAAAKEERDQKPRLLCNHSWPWP